MVHSLSECCGSNTVEIGEGIRLSAIRTRHVKGSDKTYAIKLHFGIDAAMHEWGYTSDTCFFKELGRFFQSVSVLIFTVLMLRGENKSIVT